MSQPLRLKDLTLLFNVMNMTTISEPVMFFSLVQRNLMMRNPLNIINPPLKRLLLIQLLSTDQADWQIGRLPLYAEFHTSDLNDRARQTLWIFLVYT